MTPRQRVLTALRRGRPDRVPKAANFYSVSPPEIAPRTAEEYFGCEVRFVEFTPPRAQNDFFRYLKSLPPDVPMGERSILRTYHEWSYRPEVVGQGPLGHIRAPADLDDYCFPDLTAPERYAGLRDRVDILALDDDIGEPTRMLISPATWREFFK